MKTNDIALVAEAPLAKSRADGARIASIRPDAVPGQTFSEALQTLGVRALGEHKFDIPAIEIGERIRRVRQDRKLTQAELGGRVGCKQGDISDIELGKGRDGPSYRLLRALANALDTDLMIGAPLIETVAVESDNVNRIVQANGSYRDYEPVFSKSQWADVREYVEAISLMLPKVSLSDRCTFLSLEPEAKARLSIHGTESALVMMTVRGNGTYRVHKGLHRRPGQSGPGEPVGILRSGTVVDVAADDEPMSVMMVPIGALIKHRATEMEEIA